MLRICLLIALFALLLVPLFLRPTVTSTEANTAAPAAPPPPPPLPEIRKEIVKGTIASGDTITGLLGGYFSAAEIHELSQQCKPVFPLTKLSAGQALPALP